MKVKTVSARKILDSFGNWTVETTVELRDGAIGVASVPAGVSVSGFEARMVPADRAVKNVGGSISKGLNGINVSHQRNVDEILLELDGTANKGKLGANSILSVSLAFSRAAAVSSGVPLFRHISELSQLPITNYRLPQPMVLLFEGGKHGSGKLEIQEFMAIAKDIKHGLKLYETVREHLRKNGQPLSVGLEGGFTPDIEDREAIDILNYILGGGSLALDVAFDSCVAKNLNYQHFIGNRSVVSLEDPFGSDDWGMWTRFTNSWGVEVMVVADDLVATNPERLREAIERRAANAVIIKPNQIGTLSETLEAVRMAKDVGWKVVVSHRADETNDDFIADLAVGVGADYVKFGGFSRGERAAKYNRLLQIQDVS